MSPKVAEVLFVTTKYVFRYYPSGSQAIYCDIGYQGGGGYHPLRFSVRFKILYRVIQPLIQHCLMRKTVYLNIINICVCYSKLQFFYYRHFSVINELLRYSTVTTCVLAK